MVSLQRCCEVNVTFPSVLKIRKLAEVNYGPKDTQEVSHRVDTQAQVFWPQGQCPSPTVHCLTHGGDSPTQMAQHLRGEKGKTGRLFSLTLHCKYAPRMEANMSFACFLLLSPRIIAEHTVWVFVSIIII